MADAAQPMTKSAKKRAAQKAKAAAAVAEAAAAAPAPAQAPAAQAQPKGKAKAKSQPAKAEEPVAAPVQAQPKPKAKGKAKSKAQAAKPEPVKKVEEPADPWVQYDDGEGGWEEVPTQKAKGKKKVQEQVVVGAVSQPTNTVPGMAPQGASAAQKAGAKQAAEGDVQRILNKKGEPVVEEPKAAAASASVPVPEGKIGIVIGKAGATINKIKEVTGANISTEGGLAIITGPPQGVAQAEQAVKELVEKNYCSLLFENFAENYVNVHPSAFPDIIGTKGAVIIKIKEALKVEISIPEVPKDAPANRKYRIGLAGSSENVEKAKQVINDIVLYSHHEITHPGVTHEEVDVEPWAYRFIIGPGGSQLRHIQHNWKVKVNIPREHSANQKVLIVGEDSAVERTKAYIENLVWKAEHQTKGRDQFDTSDHLGEDDDEEDWMKAYMYKR